MIALQSSPASASRLLQIRSGWGRSWISCDLSLKSETKPSSVSFKSDIAPSPDPARIGSRVRVKAPVRVYHVPRVAELELSGMEGEVKQNLLFWRGKSLTANRPFKVEFVGDVEGRGPVKFVAHLEEDEFEFI
ncbi:FeThRed_A domain-containing protein [Psidium guajava]|nr:FeThRed_A domain-containing protein [Psidium guajava]